MNVLFSFQVVPGENHSLCRCQIKWRATVPFPSPPVGGAVLNLTDHRLPGSAGPLSLGAGVGRASDILSGSEFHPVLAVLGLLHW